MNFFKKYKLLIILFFVAIIGVGIFLKVNKKPEVNNNLQVEVKDLPFKVESTPLTLNIVEEEGTKVLQATYKNDSKEVISRFVLQVKLKDTGETIEMKLNESVEPGQVSAIIKGKAPESGNIDDVEVLKYKMSLRSGIYMEYDTKLKQYNWS